MEATEVTTEVTLPKSTFIPIKDLEVFQDSLAWLQTHPAVFLWIDVLLVAWMFYSAIKWKKGTKELRKITNQYTADGSKRKDNRAPINFDLSFMLLIFVNLFWIALTCLEF
jgi:hypothetical protein